jgi:Co/Zn/Cd efflux system component
MTYGESKGEIFGSFINNVTLTVVTDSAANLLCLA